MMVAGSFGLKMDYSVRFNLKLRDEINSEILHHAVEKHRSVILISVCVCLKTKPITIMKAILCPL